MPVLSDTPVWRTDRSRTTAFSMIVSLCLLLSQGGCGPADAVIEAQNRDIKKAYEEASRNPPDLPPHLVERRRRRLEMEFGSATAPIEDADTADAKKHESK